MPQFTPFYFINQVVFGLVTLTLLIYIFSKYILPKIVKLNLTRMYIKKV